MRAAGGGRGAHGTTSRPGSGCGCAGQLTLMATMGLMTGIAYTLLGLPSGRCCSAHRRDHRGDPDHRTAARRHPGRAGRGNGVAGTCAHRGRHLCRPAVRRGQRPGPDHHAQRSRYLTAADPRQPADRGCRGRLHRRVPGACPSRRRSRSCSSGCRRAKSPWPRTRAPSSQKRTTKTTTGGSRRQACPGARTPAPTDLRSWRLDSAP